MASALRAPGILRGLDALVRTNDGRPQDRHLTLAAHPATARRAVARAPHPRRPAPANPPLQLRAGCPAHAEEPRLYKSARRRRRELVYRAAERADELLARTT